MRLTKKCFFEYLKAYARDEEKKVFLFDETRSFTVGKIFRLTCGVAAHFVKKGVKAGDKVAVRTGRSISSAIVFFALQAVGAVAVLCDPHQAPTDYVKESGVNIGIDHVIDFDGVHTLDGEPFETVDGEEKRSFVHYKNSKAPALVIFTSGSTGKSKGVTLSQYNYVNHIHNFYAVGGHLPRGDSSVQLLPLYHVFGLAQLLDGVIHRCPLMFPKEVTPDYVCQCIEKYGVTRFGFVPSFALAMAQAKIAKGYDTSSLKIAVIAGAPCTREQFLFVQKELGMTIVPVYGLSECIGIAGGAPTESDDDRASSVGKALPMNEIKTDTPSQKAEGEIMVKGPAVMLGYYGDKEETAKAFDKDGFLYTGDLGYIDERGFLHVTGRIKDMIIRNGHNLSAVAIENKLCSLPFVFQAAVVGVADESCGEAPVALVVLKEKATFDGAAVEKIFNKLEMPKEIRVVEEIPLTRTGKKDKQKIKELFTD